MTAAVYNIKVEQGATFRFPKFQFGTLLVDTNGDPILDSDGNQQIDEGRDFTGCKFRVQMRKSKKYTAEAKLFVNAPNDPYLRTQEQTVTPQAPKLHAVRTVVPGTNASTTRSEERRVGKECSLTCRSRWSPYH